MDTQGTKNPIYPTLEASKREFRILDISPSNAWADDTVSCKIRQVSLHDDPSYETISYVWGDPTRSHTVEVNGRLLKVPKNTELALRRVAKEDTERTVWIDAVCINQTDFVERSQQVTIMGDIYSQTSKGLVYLGEGADDAALAARDLEEIAREANDEVESTGTPLKDVIWPDRVFVYSRLPMHTRLHVTALVALFESPWFTRVWTLQEAILPSESICLYGGEQISLRDLLIASVWLYHHDLFLPKELDELRGFQTAARMWTTQSDVKAGSYRFTTSVLLDAGDRSTLDNRDRVFAMLGLASFGDDIPDSVRPDYDKDYLDVMRDVTRFGIEQEQNSSVFREIRHREGDDIYGIDWPSWVPRVHLPFDMDLDAVRLPRTSGLYNSEGPCCAQSSDPNVLRLNGRIFACIAKLSCNISHRTTQSIYRSYSSVFNLIEGPINVDTALQRTLLADHDWRRKRSTEATVADFPAFAARVQGCGIISDNTELGVVKVSELNTERQDTVMKCSRYFWGANRFATNRRFAVTETGHYGLVPKVCEEGDVIAILENFERPVALRPGETGQYYMLGEAYLDGNMWEDDPKVVELQKTVSMVIELV